MTCTATTPLSGLTCRAAAGPPCTRPIPEPELQRSSKGRSSHAEPPNRNRPLDVDIGQLAHREVVEGAAGRDPPYSPLCGICASPTGPGNGSVRSETVFPRDGWPL